MESIDTFFRTVNYTILGFQLVVLYIGIRLSFTFWQELWIAVRDFPHIHWFRYVRSHRCISPSQEGKVKKCRCGLWKVTMLEFEEPLFHMRQVWIEDEDPEERRDREFKERTMKLWGRRFRLEGDE